MKVVRQGQNTNDCLAACAAIATSTSLETVKRFIKRAYGEKRYRESNKEGFSYGEIAGYLAKYNLFLGSPFLFKISSRSATWLNGYRFNDGPSIVVYKNGRDSQGPLLHAIYWDGKNFYDPSPHNKYKFKKAPRNIVFIYPISLDRSHIIVEE